MPLNIKVDNPAIYTGAVLPYVPSFAEVINAVPNLIGLWEAGSVADGEVTSITPTYGPTTISRNAAGVNKSTVGGRPAVTFDAVNTRLVTTWPIVGGSPATVMCNFYVRTEAGDFQNIYGPAGYRLIYRDGSSGSFPQGLHWDGTNDLSPIPLAAPVVGWHTAELYFGAATLRLVIDGIEYSAAQAGMINDNLFFGNQASASASTSVAISKMFAANSDIYGTLAADAMKQYLAI